MRYEGLYEVSNDGQVRSKLGVLKPAKNKYWHVSLSKNSKQVTRYIHVLMAESFIGPRPPGDTQVRHLDDNPDNNTLPNIEYGTRSQNTKDSVRNGTHNQASKTHCPRGHALQPPNLYPVKTGKRVCWACRRTQDLVQRGKIPKSDFSTASDRAYTDIRANRKRAWGETRK